MRFLALPPSLLLSIVVQAQISMAELQNDFSAYPIDSQQCLSDAADQSQCTGNTGAEMNGCLCKNRGNFIYNTASCVATQSPKDLSAVYDTLENNCAGTGITIAVSKSAFMSQAIAATQTTSSATPTETGVPTTATTAAAAATQASSTRGLSTAAMIGVAVGLGLLGIGLCIAGWFVWLYSRRRKLSQSPSPNPNARDVELTQNSNNHNGSTSNFSHFNYETTPNTPAPEYAQHNPQFGAVELSHGKRDTYQELPAHGSGKEFKELPTEYYGGSYPRPDDKRSSNVPLLAELSTTSNAMPPVELPADMSFYTTTAPSPVYDSNNHNASNSHSNFNNSFNNNNSVISPLEDARQQGQERTNESNTR
ncbi:uncharacterized protein GGS25DRAFT_478458 [Hypoxylon fragiforme]|uniref:uncharacterized protein n=1 Tax=Hypoxylon fragiforme TaxID=63214 RepID=UPI0020C67844|nr:uncharacterized protein GGS25DRAFT_478458 [Hypoxylon fragiforme]KAI2613079.1 hypothetical protein GGS25DRAFT_478458 [Hypoxylon fragiforme]